MKIRHGNLCLGWGASFKSFGKKTNFSLPRKRIRTNGQSCIYVFFLSKAAGIFAGKLGVQDYAVVYPPNGTPVSLGMNNLCPLNVKRSDRLNY